MRADESRLLSAPIRVIWAGWESDTFQLQQDGWQFSAEQLVERRSLRLLMRHESLRMHGITNSIDFNFFESLESGDHYHRHIIFRVQHMATSMQVQLLDNLTAFKPVDMTPTFERIQVKSIEDFEIFAAPLVRTEEFVLPEPSVAELLTKIRSMQEPARLERIEKEVRGKRFEAREPHKFHAQIISIK